MNTIDRFNALKSKVPANIKIVAVSKKKPALMIEELYENTGHKLFGENRAQELNDKQKILPEDINWHFIGHLQTNKIKYIAPYVGLIQSVDSYRLLIDINKEAIKNKRKIPCLLQFHIASEETKFGFSIDEASRMLEDRMFADLTNIAISGVMGMATFTTNVQQIRTEFRTLFCFFNSLKSNYFYNQPEFCEVSMGMTDDYLFAIEEGSTMIRIGSGIFGGR
jgi:PLP dependent protein